MTNADEAVEVQGTCIPLTPEERAGIEALPEDVRTADTPWAPDRHA